jgi:hypothetical protein
VGDVGAASTELCRQPGGGDLQVPEQQRDGPGLFDRREVLADHVLNQRELKRVGSVERAVDQRRDRRLPRLLRRAPAALAGHDFELAQGHRSDDDRHQHATLANRIGKRGERLLVEMLARLARVRVDETDWNLS